MRFSEEVCILCDTYHKMPSLCSYICTWGGTLRSLVVDISLAQAHTLSLHSVIVTSPKLTQMATLIVKSCRSYIRLFHLKTINRYLIVQVNKLVIDDKPNFL